jgi:polyhydroxyalkanoate synthesis regulator phasin
MLEDVRKYMRLGLEVLASQGSDETGGDRRARAQVVAEQLSAFAASFLEWSAEARASLVKEIKDLVARQVQEMGLARNKDLQILQRRVDRLEERLAPTRGTANTKPKSASTTKTRAKRATRAKSAAKASGRSRAARGPG